MGLGWSAQEVFYKIQMNFMKNMLSIKNGIYFTITVLLLLSLIQLRRK